jgi:hypothetical protein
LDFNKVKCESTSFWFANLPANMENISLVMCSPTPLPPTPTPNPEQPKILTTVKGGENVTYEFWDNKVVKITGSGATYDFSYDGKTIMLININSKLYECFLH